MVVWYIRLFEFVGDFSVNIICFFFVILLKLGFECIWGGFFVVFYKEVGYLCFWVFFLLIFDLVVVVVVWLLGINGDIWLGGKNGRFGRFGKFGWLGRFDVGLLLLIEWIFVGFIVFYKIKFKLFFM